MIMKKDMKIEVNNRAFTLLEMVLAISVFVVFLTATSGSYLSLSAAMRDANQERKVYSAAQDIIKLLSDEIRDSQVDYDCYAAEKSDCKNFSLDGNKDLVVKSGDGNRRFMVRFQLEGGKLQIRKRVRDTQFDRAEVWNDDVGYSEWINYDLPQNIAVSDLQFRVSPAQSPFSFQNSSRAEFQFQPEVTILMKLKSSLQRDAGYIFPIQTTISTRVYNKISSS